MFKPNWITQDKRLKSLSAKSLCLRKHSQLPRTWVLMAVIQVATVAQNTNPSANTYWLYNLSSLPSCVPKG